MQTLSKRVNSKDTASNRSSSSSSQISTLRNCGRMRDVKRRSGKHGVGVYEAKNLGTPLVEKFICGFIDCRKRIRAPNVHC